MCRLSSRPSALIISLLIFMLGGPWAPSGISIPTSSPAQIASIGTDQADPGDACEALVSGVSPSGSGARCPKRGADQPLGQVATSERTTGTDSRGDLRNNALLPLAQSVYLPLIVQEALLTAPVETPTVMPLPEPSITPTEASPPPLQATPTTSLAASSNLVWKPFLQQLTSTSVSVRWTTKTGSSPVVRYAADNSYSSSAGGSSRTLAALGTQYHSVTLTGLRANTRYFYKVYANNEDLLPGEYLEFRTAPSTGSSTPFTFLAFGDFGYPATDSHRTTQERLRDQMLRDSFNFILTSGDNSQDKGSYTNYDSDVFGVYGDVFHRGGLFPTLGNHDTYTSGGAPYLDLFSLPKNAWRTAHQERYYSFDYGNVHFVGLDSNAPLDADDSAASDDMFDWLRDDLSRTTQRWKIVAFHHPAYSTGTSYGSDSRVQAKLVPILEQYGVHLVFNGHDHIYQRSKPLRGGRVTTIEAGGIVYIVAGSGSRASYGCTTADWIAFSLCAKSYGLYRRVTVQGDTLTVEAVDDAGTVRDKVTLGGASISLPSITVPGRIEVEDYRTGGQGVGYYDTTTGNTGGKYRKDDVDIQTTSDSSGTYNVGWIAAGEWLAYEVQVARNGRYTFTGRVASPYSGKKFHIEVDGSNVSGPLAVPNTGGWQVWRDVTSAPISLTAGKHTVRLVADTSDFNLNYVAVADAGGVITLPGRFEAEDYRSGGQGVGYYDTTSGNSGGAYRSDDVDIQVTGDSAGRYNVGWIAAGEWLAYDIVVPNSASYTFGVRVASPSSGKRFRIEIDGLNVSGSLSVPQTGGWQGWTHVWTKGIPLTAGPHTLRVIAETDGLNLNYLEAWP
jgi:hypothetical protein